MMSLHGDITMAWNIVLPVNLYINLLPGPRFKRMIFMNERCNYAQCRD
jgi:hypothetical protein